MPKRSSKELSDPIQNAFRVVQGSIEQHETALTIVGNRSLLSQVMAEIGRKGGKIGGKRRLTTMTPARRKEVAQLAAKKRWADVKKFKKKP
jgi:hypothetical protein